MGKRKVKRLGILTAGGDCPGLNAVIRAVGKTAMNDYGMELMGIKDGFAGLIHKKAVHLDNSDLSGILTLGGTILGTSNKDNPTAQPRLVRGKVIYEDLSEQVVKNCRSLGLDALVCIGGDGTLCVSNALIKKGLNIVCVPKTIDNDVWGTEFTFGFDTAVSIATEAIDRLHTTAMSHHRALVIETMGRYAGWLALMSGVAGGGDIILIPEIPYDITKVCERVKDRGKHGKRFSIIVVSEGAKPKNGRMVIREVVKDSADPIRLGGISHKLAGEIEEIAGVESRAIVLGHLQRGGTPTAFDRVLATRYGAKAAQFIAEGNYGKMVALKANRIKAVSIEEVSKKLKLVSKNDPLVKAARSIGTSFGE